MKITKTPVLFHLSVNNSNVTWISNFPQKVIVFLGKNWFPSFDCGYIKHCAAQQSSIHEKRIQNLNSSQSLYIFSISWISTCVLDLVIWVPNFFHFGERVVFTSLQKQLLRHEISEKVNLHCEKFDKLPGKVLLGIFKGRNDFLNFLALKHGKISSTISVLKFSCSIFWIPLKFHYLFRTHRDHHINSEYVERNVAGKHAGNLFTKWFISEYLSFLFGDLHKLKKSCKTSKMLSIRIKHY